MTEVVPRLHDITAAHEDRKSPYAATEDNESSHQFKEGDHRVEYCCENPAELDRQGNLRYRSLARFRSFTNSVCRLGHGTGSHIALLCVEGSQGLLLLAPGHLEIIKGEAKLRRDFIEHFGCDV